MASPGGSSGSGNAPPSAYRESRWLGEGYADITKLRHLAAKHDTLASRNQKRAARVETHIEKLRHSGTILREKAQAVLERVPMLHQELQQAEKDIQASTSRAGGMAVGSDVTGIQVRAKKLQQKIIDLQHKAKTLEYRAAQRIQKAAELKVKKDRFLEQFRLEEQEARAFRQRADRLQLATEGEVAARLETPTAPPTDPSPPPQPGPR